MRRLSFTSLLIVFVFFVVYLTGPMINCGGGGHGELICHCCTGMQGTGAMFSCSKCTHSANPDSSLWSDDTLLSRFTLSTPFLQLYSTAERAVIFKTVYHEVPYKPPKS